MFNPKNPNGSNDPNGLNYLQNQTFTNATSSQRSSSDSDMTLNIIDSSQSTENEVTEVSTPASGQEQQQRPKRVRYHRHTAKQIYEMEEFFKECHHPDDKQRKELGLTLGLEPLQIKFWFQNKRTQIKSHHERQENGLLRTENDKLRFDNERLKEALCNAACPTCGGPKVLPQIEISMPHDQEQLMTQNIRLREEIERISALTQRFGLNLGNSDSIPSSENNMSSASLDIIVGTTSTLQQHSMNSQIAGASLDPLINVLSTAVSSICNQAVITERALDAMDELTRLALAGEPMWIPGAYGMEILNQEEYLNNFHRGIVSNVIASNVESSRQSAIIIMNHVKLVEMLMNVNEWAKIFCGIVTKATATQPYSTTGGTQVFDGTQQVFFAEFQVLTPYVATRSSYFVRYCKKHSEDSWGIVDVSLDDLVPTTPEISGNKRRRPSGCIIQKLPNGYSKVIWIEHVEVDNSEVHDLYKIFVKSTLGFGARRWVATLNRQCERLASSMAINIPAGELGGVITSPEKRSTILKLAERMVRSFCTVASAAAVSPWTGITNCSNVRIMTRSNLTDPGRPFGIILSASTSLWLSAPAKRVFECLSCESTRNQWDILSDHAVVVEKMAHIANGRDPGNCVSLLRVNGPNSANGNMTILQESRTDITGSYVVYAPIEFAALNTVLASCQPDFVALLPSGFAILPDGPTQRNVGPITEIGSGGCLLTVAFQILADSGPDAKLSVNSINSLETLIKCTVEKIKDAVMRFIAAP